MTNMDKEAIHSEFMRILSGKGTAKPSQLRINKEKQAKREKQAIAIEHIETEEEKEEKKRLAVYCNLRQERYLRISVNGDKVGKPNVDTLLKLAKEAGLATHALLSTYHQTESIVDHCDFMIAYDKESQLWDDWFDAVRVETVRAVRAG